MANYPLTIISVGNAKQSALYFPHVVPIFTAYEVGTERLRKSGEKDWLMPADLDALLPAEFKGHRKFRRQLRNLNRSIALREKFGIHAAEAAAEASKDLGFSLEGLIFGDGIEKSLRIFVRKYDLQKAIVDAPSSALGQSVGSEPDVSLSLAETKLIDLDATNWDQILEFRNDKVALEKLRRFRLFAFENYAGKDRSFIEDDVAKRVDDYRETVRSWGFETKIGVLDSSLNSKAAQAALTGSLMAAFAGTAASNGLLAGVTAIAAGGVAAISGVAATAGVVVTVGNITLQLVRRRNQLNHILRENPVSFFEYANSKIVPSQIENPGMP